MAATNIAGSTQTREAPRLSRGRFPYDSDVTSYSDQRGRTGSVLSNALAAQDNYTRGHASRVTVLATLLVQRLHPSDTNFQQQVCVAAMCHDVGKTCIPQEILDLPCALNEAQKEIVYRHADLGAAIVAPMLAPEIVAMVRSHHERWGGGGYPSNLAGESIPRGGRILAVADSYDAMTSRRPYSRERTSAEAIEVLRAGSGTQWDAEVVSALCAIAAEGKLSSLPTDDYAAA